MVEVRCFYRKHELDHAAGCMQVSNAFLLSISAASPVLASLNPPDVCRQTKGYRKAADIHIHVMSERVRTSSARRRLQLRDEEGIFTA